MRNTEIDILVIEDNPGDYAIVEEYLQEGIPKGRIAHAETLEKGLEAIEKSKFNVILLDLSLPDAIGLESYTTIHERANDIPIIILTGFEDTDTALESINNGAQDYIVKDDATPLVLSKSIKYAIERNKIRAELMKSEEQYKYLFYSNPLPMLAYEAETHKIVMVNQSAITHYGYSEEELLDMEIDDLQSKVDQPDKASSLAIAGDKLEIQHQKKNGDLIDVEMAIHDSIIGGKTIILAVIQDVTERNLLIDQLTRNNIDLQQFSYITSHNLRSPLANLLSIIKLMDHSSITDPINQQLLKNFEECTYQLNDTVNDLINVLIVKNNVNVKKEILDVGKIFERVVNSMQTVIDQNKLSIETNFDDAPNVEFNRSYLESILLNLLTNAVKYKSPLRDPVIKLSTQNTAEGTRLYFADNGLGIDLERHRDRIFGLYQRFHNHADSKGLGLYMVNSQVRAMGGEIDVESEVDKGTTFIITFKKSTDDR